MRFSDKDLSDQYISASYEDVLQQYITSPTSYVLDGFGNVVFSIPSSSIGGTLVLSNNSGSAYVSNSLLFNTASSNPAWQEGLVFWDNIYGTLAVNGKQTESIFRVGIEPWITVTNDFIIPNSGSIIYASASTANIVLTLPNVTTVAGQFFRIKKIDSTGYEVIISSSVNIDYDTELRLSQRGSSVTLHSNGTQYWIH